MLATCVLLGTCLPWATWAQDALTAQLLPQGGVAVMSGGTPLATLSLNAHGPDWKHVDQAEAKAAIASADRAAGIVVRGVLPVPNTDEGAIRFAETIRPVANGLHADYVLGATRAMALNGLHVSLLLPATTFAGKTVTIHPAVAAESETVPAQKTQEIALPAQLDQKGWQLFTGPASEVEVAPGMPDAITLVSEALDPTDGGPAAPRVWVVQDLRRWDQDLIEVRLSLYGRSRLRRFADASTIPRPARSGT